MKLKLAKRIMMEDDAYVVYTNTPMFQAMRPLFVSLQLFGLYHSKDYGSFSECRKKVECNITGTKDESSNKRRLRISVSQVYCWFVGILLVTQFFRMFAMYNEELTLGEKAVPVPPGSHMGRVMCFISSDIPARITQI